MNGLDVRQQREARDWSQQGLINRIRARGYPRPLSLRALKYAEAKGEAARFTQRIEHQLAECFTVNTLPQSEPIAPKSYGT